MIWVDQKLQYLLFIKESFLQSTTELWACMNKLQSAAIQMTHFTWMLLLKGTSSLFHYLLLNTGIICKKTKQKQAVELLL